MSDKRSKLAELASRKRKEQEDAAAQQEKTQRNAPIDFGDFSDGEDDLSLNQPGGPVALAAQVTPAALPGALAN